MSRSAIQESSMPETVGTDVAIQCIDQDIRQAGPLDACFEPVAHGVDAGMGLQATEDRAMAPLFGCGKLRTG